MHRIISILALLTVLYNGQSVAATAKPLPITASSWLVADGEGHILQGKNTQQQRSIASITKLMTAMVVLDAHQDLRENINGVSRKDLLQLMLVKSDNRAAETLCENYPLGRSACISAMNWKAVSLGLYNTRYVDASGLNIMNVSTAEELVQIVIASSKYPEVVEASNTSHGKIETTNKKKKHYFSFNNTNPLVATKEFIVTKTGYIRASGGCIVMMLDTNLGRRIIVLLNSKNTYTRIPEAEFIAKNF
jgi:serine-type D-Ala-D-Ala endopeptidase (penicillin-binding protein 7)